MQTEVILFQTFLQQLWTFLNANFYFSASYNFHLCISKHQKTIINWRVEATNICSFLPIYVDLSPFIFIFPLIWYLLWNQYHITEVIGSSTDCSKWIITVHPSITVTSPGHWPYHFPCPLFAIQFNSNTLKGNGWTYW